MMPSNCQRQSGLTLIELMISMVISLILILGVVSIYISSKRGYSLTDGMGREQENIRFTADLLLHDLRMAGYPKGTTGLPPIATATDGGNSGGSDSITLQFQALTDCLGQSTAGVGGIAVNKYSIDNTNGNLICLGNGDANSGIIADGIFNMQILYGLDTNSDCVADSYVKWSAGINPIQIVSVRIALLSRTPPVASAGAATNTYPLLDQTISVTDQSSVHRVYTNTVVLRNASPSYPVTVDCPV